MPLLRNELEEYLRQCFNDLSPPWSEYLQSVTPDSDAISSDQLLDQEAQIVPLQGDHGALSPLNNLDPADVTVVVIGKAPYADPLRATGRAFEQGNLTNWCDDLSVPNRVARSLLNLVSAAAALHPRAADLKLDDAALRDRRQVLQRLQGRHHVLDPTQTMFDNLRAPGVLFLNRTPTISSRPIAESRQGSFSEHIAQHDIWHRTLWDPVLCAILSRLVDEALTRPIVFVLLGQAARELRSCIKARQRWHQVPTNNIRFVINAHPASRQGEFWADGNPLSRINDKLQGQHSIDWSIGGH